MSGRIAWAVLAATLAMRVFAAAGSTCESAEACLAAVARTQDARVRVALDGIPGTGARLLALRGYLLAGATLSQRWSWTQPQIEAFAGSQHEQELGAAVDSVRRTFERENPGYTLSVSPQVRSLDRQLQAWNTNRSVSAAAREFQMAAGLAMWPGGTSRRSAVTPLLFERFVREHKPHPTPTLAAPGLSRHGQMYAVDFHVRRGSAAVADTDSATIAGVWMAQGWEHKLRSAVLSSGAPFAGPLQEPHEPWHYDYEPHGRPGDPPPVH